MDARPSFRLDDPLTALEDRNDAYAHAKRVDLEVTAKHQRSIIGIRRHQASASRANENTYRSKSIGF